MIQSTIRGLLSRMHSPIRPRTRVFDRLRVDRSVEACIASFDGDDEALALIGRLRQTKLSPTNESFEDQSAIIQIAKDSAKRTQQEYLKRRQKRKAQQAKESGNMIRDKDSRMEAVETNLKIRELGSPRHAALTY